jgi:hypothetical protein
MDKLGRICGKNDLACLLHTNKDVFMDTQAEKLDFGIKGRKI